MEEPTNSGKESIFSEKFKAGGRTYFFDVKATLSKDYYITITESKKKFNKESDGFTYEKHKVFLYKENFDRFTKALEKTVDHVKTELMPDVDFAQFD